MRNDLEGAVMCLLELLKQRPEHIDQVLLLPSTKPGPPLYTSL